jgi:ABC-type dipeptide/oligopeptide/nickel transport system permease subunit
LRKKKLKDPLVWAGILFMVLLLLFAALGPLIPTDGKSNPVMDTVGGTHLPYGSPHALVGTDEIGRSFLQRIAYGARISLFIGFVVQAINLIFGVFIGVVSAFAPKWIAVPVMRLTDIARCGGSLNNGMALCRPINQDPVSHNQRTRVRRCSPRSRRSNRISSH